MAFMNDFLTIGAARDPFPNFQEEEEKRRKEEEEKQREQRMSVAAPAAAQARTGTDRPGPSFLASLLQSGPAIARIMTAKSTEDIQRALSDHAAVMERYRESRELSAERQRERDFASTQAEQRRAADIADREDAQQAQLDLEGLRDQNANDRLDRQLGAAEAARTAEAATKADDKFNEAMATARAQLGSASAFNESITPKTEEYLAFAARNNGQLPTEAYAQIARAEAVREKQMIAARKADADGRQVTPQELAIAKAQADHESFVDEFSKLDTIQKNQFGTLAGYVSSVYGESIWERNVALRGLAENIPEPPPPPGAVFSRILDDPTSEVYAERTRQLATMPRGQFKATIEALTNGVSDPDALLDKIERALPADSENRKELQRMRAPKTTRFGQTIDKALQMSPGYGVLKDVGNTAGSALGNMGAVGGGLLQHWFEPIPRDGG